MMDYLPFPTILGMQLAMKISITWNLSLLVAPQSVNQTGLNASGFFARLVGVEPGFVSVDYH